MLKDNVFYTFGFYSSWTIIVANIVTIIVDVTSLLKSEKTKSTTALPILGLVIQSHQYKNNQNNGMHTHTFNI